MPVPASKCVRARVCVHVCVCVCVCDNLFHVFYPGYYIVVVLI